MVDHSPRQQIKIKITQPEARREQPVTEYVYHWDRIIAALTALLLLLGALGYGIYAWLEPAGLPVEAEIQDPHVPDGTVVGGPAQGEENANAAASVPPEKRPAMVRAASPVETGSVDITGAPVRDTPDAMRSPPEPMSDFDPEHSALTPKEITPTPSAKVRDSAGEVAEGTDSGWSPGPEVATKTTFPPTVRQETAPAVTAEMPSSHLSDAEPSRPEQEPLGKPVPGSSAANASETPSREATAAASAPEADDRVAGPRASEQRSDEALSRSPNTSIASPAVKRFLLAKDVVGNEPQGDIDDVALRDAGYVEVSSFSEVIDQKGETLQYRWLHDGKEVLRIRVPVGSNRWRSHSTKRIYAGMKGDWRAELRNSAGDLLASIDFTF